MRIVRFSRIAGAPLALVGLFALIGLALAAVPLFDVLGYESSLVLAVAAGLAGPFVALGVRRRADPTDDADWWRVAGRAFLAALVPLALPIVVLVLNAVRVKNCDLATGLGFAALLPMVSALFGAACGLIAAELPLRHPRLALSAVWLTGALVVPLALLLLTPAVFLYNPFWGYFPGPLYDEALAISGRLVAYRAVTLGLTLAITLAAKAVWSRKRGTLDRPATVAALGLGLVWLSLIPFYPALGFATSTAHLRQALTGVRTVGPLTLRYDPAALSAKAVDQWAADIRFQAADLAPRLGLQSIPAVEIFVYPTVASKKLLTGAGPTNVAKPWTRQVQINGSADEGTLRHELVHALASQYGRLGFSPRIGLVEGLAAAFEWGTGDDVTPHELTAAALADGQDIDVASLMSPFGFWTRPSAVAYTATGSFSRYLIDTYGIGPFRDLYRGAAFGSVYGRDVDGLQRDWKAFLRRDIRLTDQATGAARYRFGRPSIFGQACARVMGDLVERGGRALGRGDNRAAVTAYTDAARLVRGQPAVLDGLSRAYLALGRPDSALLVVAQAFSDSGASGVRLVPLRLREGDARWTLGDTTGAAAAYQTVLNRHLDGRYDEAAADRLFALTVADSGDRTDLRRFFSRPQPAVRRTHTLDRLLAAHPDWTPIRLRLAADLLAAEAPGESTDLLLPGPPDTLATPLRLRWWRLLAASALAADRPADAERAARAMRTLTNLPALRDEADATLRRLHRSGSD